MEECILPIDPVAVIRQFDRLALRQSVRSLPPSFLTAEISKRMNERLDYIRLDPKYILDAGCGNGDAIQRLAARYKNTTILGLDASEGQLAVARQRWPVEGMRSLWRKATGRPKIQFQKADAGYFVPPWPIDLLWSNCFLHWVPQPHKMIAHWTNILAPGGLLMLSCFGPDSFKQIRAAAKIAGLPGAVLPFVDMHDLGDMLVASQLNTPVMDAEILTLTYATAPALLADMRLLGGNPHLQRSPSLTGKARWQRFIQALEDNAGPDGRLCLTVEIIYGHGWRPLSQPNALRSQQIPLDVLAASLPSRRTHPKQG
jgi:malonyl-CoA O-methyltransferase